MHSVLKLLWAWLVDSSIAKPKPFVNTVYAVEFIDGYRLLSLVNDKARNELALDAIERHGVMHEV